MTQEEAKLREIIKEEVRKVFYECMLNEMAFDLGKYKDQVRNHMQQIAINWCLVRYTTYDENFIQLRRHWSSELLSQMNFIAGMKIKGKDDTSTKQKALYSIWNEFEFDTDERAIDMMVSGKFESEGIDTYSEQYIQTTVDFKEASKEIIEVILSGSRKVIQDYVLNI